MATTCKTREDARSGKRDKPHYYLHETNDRNLTCITPVGITPNEHFDALVSAYHIDLSTWGPSR